MKRDDAAGPLAAKRQREEEVTEWETKARGIRKRVRNRKQGNRNKSQKRRWISNRKESRNRKHGEVSASPVRPE